MIDFTPYFPWFWTLVFISFLLVIWAFQLVWTLKSQASGNRKAVKALLSGWLTLVLVGFLLQPNLKSLMPNKAVAIDSGKTSKERLEFLKDSLKIDKVVPMDKYEKERNPVFLIGQDFSLPFLHSLKGKTIHWIPELQTGALSFLEWKGIVRQGEIQQVSGRLHEIDSTKIELVLNGETVATKELGLSETTFQLEFTGKIAGNNELELLLGGERLGAIHFFVQDARPKNVAFQFGFPNPESRFLTQYLAEKGEKVSFKTQVSQNLDVITGSGSQDSTHLVITEVSQIQKKEVKAALENGASLLVMNISDPSREIPMLNKLLETDFELESIGTEEQREIQRGLLAFPERFVSKMGQIDLLEGAIAVQHSGISKIGISLLESTFPLLLQGDSVGYNRIWDQILGALAGEEATNWNIPQPIFQNSLHRIALNEKNGPSEFAILGQDTVYLRPSLVNPMSASGVWQPSETGWIALNDSLEIYSYGAEEWAGLAQIKAISEVLKASVSSNIALGETIQIKKIGGWAWLVLIMVAFGMVWIEPRL